MDLLTEEQRRALVIADARRSARQCIEATEALIADLRALRAVRKNVIRFPVRPIGVRPRIRPLSATVIPFPRPCRAR